MTDAMCTALVILVIVMMVAMGALIVSYAKAMLSDECKFCECALDTYTDEDGKVHFWCDHCRYNKNRPKEKDS